MDLHFLRGLTEPFEPCATVYLDASHDSEDAEHALRLRWQEQRTSLEEHGADARALDALENAILRGHRAEGRAGRVLVARGAEVALDRFLPEPPDQPSATWGPAPDLLPMLLQLPEPMTAVVVRVDKNGGEILLADPSDVDAAPQPVEALEGDEYPLHKVRGGGWKHLKMQHTVENNWRSNVRDVAERVDRRVAETGARLVVLAGEAQSRRLLHDNLGEESAKYAVEVEHSGMPSGANDPELEAAVDVAARDASTRERLAVLEHLDQVAARPDGAFAQGIRPVLAALRAEQVDTLLLDGGVERAASVWIAEAPTHVALDREELEAMGDEPVDQVPVDSGLLRAASGSGAAFQPLGGGRTGLVGRPVEDGVAALLRWAPATSS
ncbi:MAG TPA: Vms1/Ankzf1 family peptidyl-tRNA hydrolase [Pseudonocardia sp.]